MTSPWRILNYFPASVLVAMKGATPLGLRRWLRAHLGGTYKSIPDGTVVTVGGRRFRIGPDEIYWSLFVGQDFEPEATAILRKLVRPGDTIVDAGANYGWYTTLFAELVGSRGRVYAFEPVPATFARLSEHLTLNGCEDRVVAEPSAVGAERGEIQVHVFNNLSHSRSSLSHLNQLSFTTHVAPLTDLDSYLKSRGVDRLDFLKCDVEGSELSVLQGARRILEAEHAPIILVELNDETSAAFGYKPTDIWKLLTGWGYDRFYAIQSKEKIRPIAVEDEIASVNLLLCGKGDRIESRLAERRRTLKAA